MLRKLGWICGFYYWTSHSITCHPWHCEITTNLYSRNETTFGLRSFTYFKGELLNGLPIGFKGPSDLALFINRLRQWRGPNIDDVINFYVYFYYSNFQHTPLVISKIFIRHCTDIHAIFILGDCARVCMWICLHIQTYTPSTCIITPALM